MILLHVCAYLLVGILGYKYGEEYEDGTKWTFVDGFYFTMMTMSTVGYGDISPSNTGMRVFTLFMIFWGIILIWPLITTPFTISPAEQRLQRWLSEIFPRETVDIDGNGEEDYTLPRRPAVHYFKQLFPSVLVNVLMQLIYAGIFVAIEDEWDYFDALYHCLVTATTVGYGDQTIVTQGGRLWASVHMLLSVAALGEMISRVGEVYEARQAEMRKVRVLQRRLDVDLLKRLINIVKEVRPDMKRDGLGLTEMEFVLCMMLELDMMSIEDIRPFIKQFRKLDVDGSRRLNVNDLQYTDDQIALIHQAKDKIAMSWL
jgi:potassium channel subfamily K